MKIINLRPHAKGKRLKWQSKCGSNNIRGEITKFPAIIFVQVFKIAIDS